MASHIEVTCTFKSDFNKTVRNLVYDHSNDTSLEILNLGKLSIKFILDPEDFWVFTPK